MVEAPTLREFVDIYLAQHEGEVGEQAGLPLHRFNLEDAPAAHARVEVLITVGGG